MMDDLVMIFGAESTGTDSVERASSSTRTFVRSQDHLAIWTPNATGRRLTAREALEAYGIGKLGELIEHGSAILPPATTEPAKTLQTRREALGLSHEALAKAAGLTVAQVAGSEDPTQRSPVRQVERIAIALGLDERLVGFQVGAGGDDGLAARLRTLGQKPKGFSTDAVTTFAEVAWVIRTEKRLADALGSPQSMLAKFHSDTQYGDRTYPAWLHGYYLASRTRQILGIDPVEPIDSMRGVCRLLRVPLIQVQLPDRFAGATVASGGSRGIAVNVAGSNSNVWVRRATIAHELGHLLWDPPDRLQSVRVDTYAELQEPFTQNSPDHVEARANAFAVAFLAPPLAVEATLRDSPNPSVAIRNVMDRFGIGFTAASYHTWNAAGRSFDRSSVRMDDIAPTDDWRGREAYTDDYFPLSATPRTRRGEFAGKVVHSRRLGLLSSDTAATYLNVPLQALGTAENEIVGLFPISS